MKKPFLALVFREEGRQGRGAHSFYHLNGCVVLATDRGIRNPDWRDDDLATSCWDSYRITCQGSNDKRTDGVYAWEGEFEDIGSLNLMRAEKCVKALKHVRSAMERIAKDWGRPASFGQFCLHQAKAIGAAGVYLVKEGDRRHCWDEMDLISYTVTEGASAIDWKIDRWRHDDGQQEAA